MNETTPPLQELYPFLHGQEKDSRKEASALLESVQQKARESVTVKEQFFTHNSQQLVDAAKALADVFRRGGRLFTMGNGGSHCDASHVAVEFQHPVTAGRPALTAIDLGGDITMMTAVGNDIGFEHVYVRRLIALGQRNDALLGLSTSGNSDNLMRAFEKAKAMNMTTLGLAGMDGGTMVSSGAVDHCLVVNTDSIHRIQECHVAAYHILWDLVHTLLADSRGGLQP